MERRNGAVGKSGQRFCFLAAAAALGLGLDVGFALGVGGPLVLGDFGVAVWARAAGLAFGLAVALGGTWALGLGVARVLAVDLAAAAGGDFLGVLAVLALDRKSVV